MRTSATAKGGKGTNFRNHLLSSLNEAGRNRFREQLQCVELDARQVLYSPNQRISDIYFPENCVISMLTVMKNGASIESATVGYEGASWVSASFKSRKMPYETMVTVSGEGHKIAAEAVEREVRENPAFHDLLSHYGHMLLIQTLRSTACNGIHSLEQRCARWMLATLDRVDADRFAITHDFLSDLLGVRRAGVSLLIERLAAKRVLEVERGQVRVADREKLEKLSCECYALQREQFESFLAS